MTGVANHKVIDVIAETADGDVLLVMTEARPWGGPDHVEQLRAKLNTYMNYILQGALVQEHPRYEGRKTFVALYCAHEPLGEVKSFLQFVVGKNLELGVPFIIEVRSDKFDGEVFNAGGMNYR